MCRASVKNQKKREKRSKGLPGQRGRSLEGVVDELGNVRMERTTSSCLKISGKRLGKEKGWGGRGRSNGHLLCSKPLLEKRTRTSELGPIRKGGTHRLLLSGANGCACILAHR